MDTIILYLEVIHIRVEQCLVADDQRNPPGESKRAFRTCNGHCATIDETRFRNRRWYNTALELRDITSNSTVRTITGVPCCCRCHCSPIQNRLYMFTGVDVNLFQKLFKMNGCFRNRRVRALLYLRSSDLATIAKKRINTSTDGSCGESQKTR